MPENNLETGHARQLTGMPIIIGPTTQSELSTPVAVPREWSVTTIPTVPDAGLFAQLKGRTGSVITLPVSAS